MNRITTQLVLGVVFVILLLPLLAKSQSDQPNVILITLDDCNDYIQGFDGHPQIQTPAIKQLIKQGTLFYNAYANSPKCAPSRVSMYTGKHADYTDVYHNFDINCIMTLEEALLDNGVNEFYTIPGVLKDSAGYFTYSIGKNMHCHKAGHGYDFDTEDACAKEESWNKITLFDDFADQLEIVELGSEVDEGIPDFHFAAIPDSLETKMQDYLATDSAIHFIDDLAADSTAYCAKPFFLALGFRRPHGPFYIPEKYFLPFYNTRYDNNKFSITFDSLPSTEPVTGLFMPPQPDIKWADYFALPEDGVARAMIQVDPVHDNIMLEVNSRIAAGTLPPFEPGLSTDQRTELFYESYRANMVMSYMAAIQYIDAQIARLIGALEDYPEILDNTIVIILGDHGYSLGEKAHWKKGGLWETDIRTPLLVVDFRNPVQKRSNKLVSLIDLFPTILDLTGTPEPMFSDGTTYLDGHSFVPLLENPNADWDKPVLSYYRNGNDASYEGGCFPHYSIRTSNWHYIKHHTNGDPSLTACYDFLSEVQDELYNIGVNRDIDPYEWFNLADEPGYNKLKSRLSSYMPGGENFKQFARESFEVDDRSITSDKELKLLISPNPSASAFNVLVPGAEGNWNLTVSTITGQSVYYNEGRNLFDTAHEFKLNDAIRPWSPGVYVVSYRQGEKVRTGKVVITD